MNIRSFLVKIKNWALTPVERELFAEKIIRWSNKYLYPISVVFVLLFIVYVVGYKDGYNTRHAQCNYPPGYKDMYEAYMMSDTASFYTYHVKIEDSLGRVVNLMIMPTANDSLLNCKHDIILGLLARDTCNLQWQISYCRWPFQYY